MTCMEATPSSWQHWLKKALVIVQKQRKCFWRANCKGTKSSFSKPYQYYHFFWAQKNQEKILSSTSEVLDCKVPMESHINYWFLTLTEPPMSSSCQRGLQSPKISKAKVLNLEEFSSDSFSNKEMWYNGTMDECLFFNWSHCKIKKTLSNADIKGNEKCKPSACEKKCKGFMK